MPWKVRNGTRYYYQSIREGDRVRSEYVGVGRLAEMAVLMDEARRRASASEAEACKAERRDLDARGRAEAGRYRAVEMVVVGSVEAAGFRRHNRGDWRRSKMVNMLEARGEAGPPAPLDEILEVLQKAQVGDEPAADRLRELIALDPARMIECAAGNLARQVEHRRVEELEKLNPIFGISVPEKLKAIRRELGFKDAPPIERLLIDRGVLCWLDLYGQELPTEAGVSLRQAEHRDKARSRAHRRYLSALRSLASVRKLGLTVILAQVDARTVVNVDRPNS